MTISKSRRARKKARSAALPIRLKNVHSMTQLGNWFRSKGLTPGENSAFDVVWPVHVGHGTDWRSWHYHVTSSQLGPRKLAGGQMTPQGNLAIDLNDTSISDDAFHRFLRGQWRVWRPQSETEALNYVYDRVLAAAKKHHWPLQELFFAHRGYIRSDPTHNHIIPNHMDHLHVSCSQHSW